MKRAIFILGMHRSGTSVLARIVNLLGVELGGNLMQAADDNQKGFFEHEPIVQIHEALLTELGMHWSDSTPLPLGWETSDAARYAQAEIEKIIDADFANSNLWALKDPRQCRLMALWLPVLEKKNIEPYFIIAYREPAEVAASLAKRDKMGEEAALATWLTYTVDALLSAIDFPHAVIRYDALLQDWQRCAKEAAKTLKLEWPVAVKDAEENVSAFISNDLRHHKIDSHDYPKPIETCLKQLEKPSRKALEKLHHEIDETAKPYSDMLRALRMSNHALEKALTSKAQEAAAATHAKNDLLEQYESLQQQHDSLQTKLRVLHEQLDGAQQDAKRNLLQLERIHHSASWKLTQPLRTMKKLVKQADSE